MRVIILTGAGRGFCSGLDLKDAAEGKGIGGAGTLSPGGGALHFGTRNLPTTVLHQLDTPVMCAINGPAAGYGLDLALGCDMRLMSRQRQAHPGVREARHHPGERRHLVPAALGRLGEGV